MHAPRATSAFLGQGVIISIYGQGTVEQTHFTFVTLKLKKVAKQLMFAKTVREKQNFDGFGCEKLKNKRETRLPTTIDPPMNLLSLYARPSRFLVTGWSRFEMYLSVGGNALT
jgi:hypothetical protein